MALVVCMMNTIYSCCIASPWLGIAKELEARSKLKAVYFLGWAGELDKNKVAEALPSSHFQTVEDAWKGKGFAEVRKINAIDEGVMARIAREELIAIKMMDRIDPTGRYFSFVDRQYFFRDLLVQWMDIIDALDVRVVISPSVPHRVFDYALYVASTLKKCIFLSFQMTPFEDRSFLIDSIDKVPDHLTKYSGAMKEQPSAFIENKIQDTRREYSAAIPDYMVAQEAAAREGAKGRPFGVMRALKVRLLSYMPFARMSEVAKSYFVKDGVMPKDSYYTRGELFFIKRKRAQALDRYIKIYNAMTTNLGGLPSKYVLLALHYQPEETSSPTGGVFVDQALILKMLDIFLPADIKIVVKEHKSQFYHFMEGASGRSDSFYKLIAESSARVLFVSVDEDPFRLIDNALASVTVSGTIGWESAIRGTPVLIFGRAWYEGMPRVFRIEKMDDLRSAWPQVLASKDKTVDSDIAAYHRNLEKHLIKAVHYKTFAEKNLTSEVDSKNNIISSILSYIDAKVESGYA